MFIFSSKDSSLQDLSFTIPSSSSNLICSGSLIPLYFKKLVITSSLSLSEPPLPLFGFVSEFGFGF